MPGTTPPGDREGDLPERAHSDDERLNRELLELLNELRVALPGVQVLFAFLLTVPFTQRFAMLSDLQRDVYFGTLMAAAGASTMFIAPSAYHRIRWRHHDKERLLTTANKLSIVGIGLLAVSMSGAVFVIADVLFGSSLAALVTAGTAGLFGWFWFGLPISRRHDPPHPMSPRGPRPDV
jgi:uncharacterized protein DUF6328